jgi:hypothetical protein
MSNNDDHHLGKEETKIKNQRKINKNKNNTITNTSQKQPAPDHKSILEQRKYRAKSELEDFEHENKTITIEKKKPTTLQSDKNENDGTKKQWEKLFNKYRTQVNNSRQHDIPSATKQRHKLRQQRLHPSQYQQENIPFGDDINKDNSYEGIIFHNINGLKDEHNWLQIMLTMQEINASVFGLAELNTTMKGYSSHKWNEITRKVFKTSKSVSSESNLKFNTEYKPGGTMTSVVDKWQARVTEKGTDESGLGRWSYTIMSSNSQTLAIITAYKPCKTPGPNTSKVQKDPDPIKEFLKDLNDMLSKWRDKHYEIILMIDANKEVGASPGGLGQIMANNGMYDILAMQRL